MNINEKRNVSPKYDFRQVYYDMMFGPAHKKFGKIHHYISTVDVFNIAEDVSYYPKDVYNTTLGMIAYETSGFRWQEKQLEHYNCGIIDQSEFLENEEECFQFLSAHVNALVHGVNSSPKSKVRQVCYNAIHMLDSDNLLRNKTIYLDRKKSLECNDKIRMAEINFSEEQSAEDLWRRLEPSLRNMK